MRSPSWFLLSLLLKHGRNAEVFLWFLNVRPSKHSNSHFNADESGLVKSCLPCTKSLRRDKNGSLLISSACLVTDSRFHLNSFSQGRCAKLEKGILLLLRVWSVGQRHQLHSRKGFLNLDTIDIWGQKTLSCGSTITGLYPPDANTPSSDIAKGPLEAKSPQLITTTRGLIGHVNTPGPFQS